MMGGHPNRAVFLDRDGTLAPDVNYCRRPEDFNLFSDVPHAVKTLNDTGLKVIVITNQSGIARGFFTGETLDMIHQNMLDELKKNGAYIDAIYYCPHHPDDKCECRKPGTALFQKAAHDLDIDLAQSFVVGDRAIDIQAGQAIGSKTVLVSTGPTKGFIAALTPDYVAENLLDAADWIKKVVHE